MIPGLGCDPGMADVQFGSPVLDDQLNSVGTIFGTNGAANESMPDTYGSLARSGLSGLGSSPQVQLVLAATQAVHSDVAQGVSLDRARADLAQAGAFLNSVPVTDPDYSIAQAAVSSAQLDYENLASHQAGAAAAQADFLTASGSQSQFFGTGGQPIDTGSGSVAFDATAGTADDLARLSPSLALGVPGIIYQASTGWSGPGPGGQVTQDLTGVHTTTDQRNAPFNMFLNVLTPGAGQSDQARCLATGGHWDAQAQACSGGTSWCDAIPSPLNYACKHPTGTILVIGGLVAAPWLVPWLVKLVKNTWSAA